MRLESSKDDTAPTIAWVVGAGGDGTDEGLAIALDHSPSSTGGAYITGYFHGNASFVGAPSAPATVLAGVAAPSGVKTQDAFVAHVDSTGAFTFAVEVLWHAFESRSTMLPSSHAFRSSPMARVHLPSEHRLEAREVIMARPSPLRPKGTTCT